jgi:hypothetical protein
LVSGADLGTDCDLDDLNSEVDLGIDFDLHEVSFPRSIEAAAKSCARLPGAGEKTS